MADASANWWQQDQDAPTGDAFLKALPPDRASMVKALAEGRMKLPSSMGMRSPMGQQLLSDVAQYDPTFDAANAGAREATRKAFTSGKQGQNISSFNTALGHLGTLAQRAEDLHNGSFPLWNGIANSVESAVGDPRKSNFNIAKTAVVDELTRAFRGTGGNVHDLEQWEANISAAQSPAQLRGAIQQAAQLLQSRVQAMGDSYNAGMGTTDQPLPLLNAHANDALARFQSKDYLEKGYGAVAPLLGGDNQPPVVGPPGMPPGSPPGAPPAGGTPAPPAPTGAPPAGSPPAAPGPGAMDGPSTTPTAISFGPTHDEVDPQASALIDRLIRQGATADQINAEITKLGPFHPVDPAAVTAAQDYLKAHPNYAGSFGRAVRTADNTLMQRALGTAPAAAATGFVDSASLGVLPKVAAGVSAIGERLSGDNRSIGDIYDTNLGTANATRDAIEQAHPLAYLGGNVGGFIAGDGMISAIPGVSKIAGRIPGTLRPLAGDALYGAAYGAGSTDHLADLPGNILKGAVLAGGGGVVGRGVVKGAAAIASPVASAAVRRLTDAGVTLTPGQILGAGGGVVGRTVKGIEDRAAGFPIVGDIINNARRGGVEDFNRSAINDALAPIGETAADVGHSGIADARQKVSDAYQKALGGMSATPDATFTADLKEVGAKAKTLSADYRERLSNILDTDLQPYLHGKTELDGSDLQAIKQGLDKRISSLSGQGASPQDRELADRLGEARDAVLNLAGRTDPASAADFASANRAHSFLSRVEAAAAKSKDGVFSPNQFRQAVTKRGYGTTTRNVASGSAPMQQLATDASTILPSAVPDSGTSGRAALGLVAGKLGAPAAGAVLGGGAGHETPIGTLGGALLGAAAFTRPGLRVTQSILAGSRGRKLDTLGDLLRRNTNLGGAVGSPLLLQKLSN